MSVQTTQCFKSSLFLADIEYGDNSSTTDPPSTVFDTSEWLFDIITEISKFSC